MTVFHPQLGEHYHSTTGAMGESLHVFIKNGLEPALQKFSGTIHVLEYGFGTGLNALLTSVYGENSQIAYTGIEKFPLIPELWEKLDYARFLKPDAGERYFRIMSAAWNKEEKITESFFLTKLEADFRTFVPEAGRFQLVYFDAFSAAVQPELWTCDIFSAIYHALCKGGLLVTYSAKGSVKQALRQVGFTLERLPGFGGKRHMLRAIKSS